MAGAKKNFKATKKFEAKHLKGVLDQRKSVAKLKQRQQIKTKKQAKHARDAEFYKGGEGEEGAAPKPRNSKTANVNDMSVDDFFGGGFEIIDKAQPGKKGAKKQTGKRKRDDPTGDDDEESDFDISDVEQPQADGVEDSDEDASDFGANDINMSKAAMENLAKDDPEFYKFLQENDPDALAFDDDDLAEVDDLSGSDAGEDEEQPKKKKQKKDKKKKAAEEDDEEMAGADELTAPMVARWKQSLSDNYSLRAARQVVLAFRSAAYLNEEDAEDRKQKYTISDPTVFHEILMVALKQIPEVLNHHLPIKESTSGKIQVPTENKKFKTLSALLRSFVSAILHLLTTLSDDATLKLTLSALEPLVPYLLSFRKLLKALIKTVVAFWSQATSSDSTRITAFLVMRRLVVIGDKGVREAVLKVTYQGLLAGARVTNTNTVQGINLMKNSAAELWGIDQTIGYTTAFSFIRQSAIHLRNSIVHNQNDSFKTVYNWQYVHSLDFWSCVLAEHCSPLKEAEAGRESQLRPLIYPLVQVTLGAMRLIPTSTYFPLRFHLIRSLLRLSRSTGTYIPLASALLEVLNAAEMRHNPKATTMKPLDFAVNYKAPKSYLRTRVYQDGIGEQVVELFAEYFVLWSTNIAFPEFALPVIITLKRWLKQSRKKSGGNNSSNNNKLRTGLVLLVQKLEANAKFIEGRRAKVDFAPKDRAQVDNFLKGFEWEKTPVGAYVVAQRRAGAEKAKMLEQARREDKKKRKEEEQEALEDRMPESDDDDEEEEEDDDDVDEMSEDSEDDEE
ncbi:Noc2p family-domain-containing protein [Microdochium trichocladiopsis]|uniref:Noc2p family-domain-containing protein n=1 Tax=Microdochium trichocladiopsis TaxID=1682393 RepID=A0A9P8Y1I3_9PEZI|nr:Noc2p family-domain-containing protein [Microdochium trichocladiopsis]KAH7027391.1 Noc2p family-domain-containing protein [Microdochium trichocladiopsis]